MWTTTGKLLGLAEVKIPFRRLAQEDHQKVMQGIYKVLTTGTADDKEAQIGSKAIGIIDEYFARQEIVLEENPPGEFTVRCQKELILQFRCVNILFVGLVRDNNSHVIFVTRSPNFGRAAVLLQFKNNEDAVKVEEKLKHGQNKRHSSHGKEETASQEPKVLSRLTSLLANPKKLNSPLQSKDSKHSEFFLDDESLSDDNDSEEEANANEKPESLRGETSRPSTIVSAEKARDPQKLIEAEIDYILETEHKYVNVLTGLEENRDTLAKNAPLDIRKWLSQLFRQVKSLATTHENLLTTLCEARYDIEKFSEAFVTHNKQFRYYVYYIENIPTVDKILSECSPYFKQHIPDLAERLRQPRLRLNHYVLMLESLQKKVEDQYKDSLQQAINLCKQYLKEADHALLLTSIRGCPFQVSQCGDYIFQSELQLSASPDLPNTRYSVILMEKKLLIVLGKLDNFQYVHSIPVDEIILRENARGLYFTLYAINEDRGTGNKRYVFKARNIRLQQEWLKKLHNAIESLKKNLERNSARTSFGRSAKKFRKRLTIPRSALRDSARETDSPSDSSGEWNPPKHYWMERRKNNKKFSSHKEKKNLPSYSSGSLSDGEESQCIMHGMAPLTVWNFFPKLESLYKMLGGAKAKDDVRLRWILEERNEALLMNAIEKKYVDELQRQLGTFLKDDIEQPPKPIQKDIRHLYELHNEKLLPNINEYEDVEQGFLKTLTKYGENIAVVYSEFLINRCTFHEEMMCLDLKENFLSPLNHFIKYCIGVILIRHESKFENELLSTAATILHDTITNANNFLMAECINNAPFALSQCEPISVVSRLRVKIDTRSKHECEVVLVKDRLFILEIQPPLYNCICSLQLDCVSLGPGSNSFEFQLVHGTSTTAKKVYTFRAHREDIIERWITEIRTILTEQAYNLKLAVSKRSEEAPSVDVGKNQLPVNHTVNISRSPAVRRKNSPHELQSPIQADSLAVNPSGVFARSPGAKKKSLPKISPPNENPGVPIVTLTKSPGMKKKSLQETDLSPARERFI